MSETRKSLCGFPDRCSPSDPYCDNTPCVYHDAVLREAEQTLRAHAPHLLAATPPAAETGEPVAWMLEYDPRRASSRRFTMDEIEANLEKSKGRTVTPLYAAPAPREASEAMAWQEVQSIADNLNEVARRLRDEDVRVIPSIVADTLDNEAFNLRAMAALSAETGTPE